MKRLLSYVVISISMLIFSCRTDSDLGLGILPEDDILNPGIIDTLSTEVYTLSSDTISTKGTSKFILGEYTDPIFGKSKASFLCQFGLYGDKKFSTYTNPVADSVILMFTGDTTNLEYYGDLSKTQTFRVYRLSNDIILSPDSSYYSNQDPSQYTTGNILAETTLDLDENSDTIKIVLDQSLANEFISAADNNFSNDTTFLDFFKGIYVSSDFDDDNGYVYKLYASSALITVHFHDADNDSLVFRISPNVSRAVRFNMYDHDYSGTHFENSLDSETDQDSVAYIQSMSGVRAKIKIPGLDALSELGNITVYRAELVVYTAPSAYTFEDNYSAVPELILLGYDPESEYYLLEEYNLGTSYYGEEYEDGEYHFEIGSYIRNLLDGEIQNNGFYLFPSAGQSFFERTVITSGNNSKKMKLYITYQKL